MLDPSVAEHRPSVAVIGGGPAGLMAAQVLAERGLRVTVVDQMPTLGRKFLLAGRSGLNLTHSEDIEALLDRYGASRERLEPALRAFDADALRAWARALGEDTYVGSSGRVFPDSWRATALLRLWLRHLASLGVRAETATRWAGWDDHVARDDGRVGIRLIARDGVERTMTSDAVILALGGASWPRTGSDGNWVQLLRSCGLTVNDLVAANAGVEVPWEPTFLERFEGTPIKNVAVSYDDRSVRGELVVTRKGLEGTPVYTLSSAIRRTLAAHPTTNMHLDLKPDLSENEVAQRLRSRRPKDSFANWIRRRLDLDPVATALVRGTHDGPPPTDAAAVADRIKHLTLTVHAVAPINRSISSAGGVPFDALDERLMLRSRPGTFAAGEMVDWDAPTGGYLLQATFSMAVLAARAAADWVTQEHQ